MYTIFYHQIYFYCVNIFFITDLNILKKEKSFLYIVLSRIISMFTLFYVVLECKAPKPLHILL